MSVEGGPLARPTALPIQNGSQMIRLGTAPGAGRVVKLVRALRKGWISREKKPEKPQVYLIWEDDGEPRMQIVRN